MQQTLVAATSLMRKLFTPATLAIQQIRKVQAHIPSRLDAQRTDITREHSLVTLSVVVIQEFHQVLIRSLIAMDSSLL
jgi:hypothetical protein